MLVRLDFFATRDIATQPTTFGRPNQRKHARAGSGQRTRSDGVCSTLTGVTLELVCSVCGNSRRPLDGAIVLGVDTSERVERVCSVDYVCEDACLSKASEKLPPLKRVLLARELDPFEHLEQTIPSYDWDRGAIQRFAQMLAAIHSRRLS